MMKQKIFSLLLIIAALAAGQSAWAASTFTVDIQSSSSSSCTFRISREGNTSVSETIDWRVVSLSAMAGMHFTGYNNQYSGTVTFNVNDTYVDIPISETTPSGTNSDCFQFQNTTSRSYRFEVLDKNGDILASKDRTITTGTQFTNAYVNQSVTDLVYFTDNGSITSGSGNKYLDVSYSSSNWIQVTDGGYKQGVHTVSTNSLYNNNTNLRSYLHNREYKMYATVYFTQKEEQDGYQYIQIYTGSAGTYDTGDDPNGGVNDPSNSLYKACFILSYSPSGSVMSDSHYQFFPHRYDDVDKATETSHNITHYEFDYNNSHLYQQKFKTASPSYKASNSGSLVLTTATENIHIRFDAGGSDGDTWDFKDLKVRLALVDNAAPTVINNYMVSGGRHQKGNTIYVSVPFKEIVTVTGTPTLSSNWGTLSYIAGSGSNVLTFSGTIDPTDNNPFSVSSYSLNGGTIKDLAGNSFSGSISHSFGTTLDKDYAWSTSDFNSLGTNTYEIANKTDLRHLALLVNAAKNACTGLIFQQTRDITCDNTHIPIGYHVSNSDEAQFRGTYDGQGFTVSGITVSRTGNTSADDFVGLFGYVHYNSSTDFGTVKNVVLANSTFTGRDNLGGIVGYNDGGTVQNCRVLGTVTINAGQNDANSLGGIVGDNHTGHAKVIGCYSAAAVSANGKTDCWHYGGIVGYNSSGTVKDCLYAGTTVTAADDKGAIVGYDYDNKGVFSNNYYTAISLGGVGADGSSSDRDGARRARTVSLGTGVALVGDETPYEIQNHSSLTAIGTTALSYNNGTTTTLYSGEGQTLTLNYTGDALGTGYTPIFSVDETQIARNTFTMPANNVSVTVAGTDVWGVSGTPAADGSAEHPYLIGSTHALDLLAKNVNGTGYTANNFQTKYFCQTANLTYDGTENNYTAIGNSNHTFSGHYNGGGYSVSGININSTNSYIGLFGYVYSPGTVENVTLANSTICGYQYVGGLVGMNNNGTVQNCRVESSVTINAVQFYSFYHGGVVGNNRNGTISGCFCGAEVNNNGNTMCNYYGGIVGGNISNGIIKDCLYTGTTVIGSSWVGSIAGKNDGGSLTNNYYTAIDLGAMGVEDNSNDQNGARRARTVTLGEGVTIVGDETAYNVSSLTAIGTGNYALRGGSIIYSGQGQTLTLSYSGDVPEGNELAYTVNGTPINGNTFTMPDEDVTVSAVLPVSYIDEDGTEKRCYDYTPITSDVTTYGTGGQDKWYVVNGNVTITDMLVFQGNAHLILMDGATLNVNNNSEDYFEDILGPFLIIYAQSTGANMGSLVVNNQISSGLTLNGGNINGSISTSGNVTINGGTLTGSKITFNGSSGTLTINGGTVNVEEIGYGREHTCRSMTINGGTVNVSSYISFDIYSNNIGGTLTINGGILTANLIEAEGEGGDGIILGWTHATDRITVNTYSGSVSVKDGQCFSDGTAFYSGTLSDAQVNAIKRKTLSGVVPDVLLNDDSTEPADGKNTARIAALADGQQHNIVLQGRTLYKDGYWNTLCLPFDLTISGSVLDGNNVDVRTLSSTSFNSATGELTLNFTAEGAVTTLTAGTPYIIKWSKTDENDPDLSNLVNPVFTGVTVSSTPANVETTYVDFKDTYAPISFAEDNKSILFVGEGNTLYYPQSGAHLNSFRAYFQLNNGLTAEDVTNARMNFDSEANGITTTNYTNLTNSDAWYTLDGRKLSGKPTKKGIYIYKGKKVKK